MCVLQVVDAINHAETPNCQFDEEQEKEEDQDQAQGEGGCASSNGPAVIVRATRDIQAGEEILVRYGSGADAPPKSPIVFFVGYGFVPPELKAPVSRAETATNAMEGSGNRTPEETLDSLHAAASRADGDTYFALFDPTSAVFLGTDATERWPIDAFRGYAGARFAAGDGWTYKVKERHVILHKEGTIATFDEALEHAKLGICRSTGTLLRSSGSEEDTPAWRVLQYSLSMPIPNEKILNVAAGLYES